MLRVLGTAKRLCDGMTRREALRVGGLGLAGLSLADFFRLQEAQASRPRPRSFGKAKSCILLYLYGSPSQLETFDPKPDSAPEIRGTGRSWDRWWTTWMNGGRQVLRRCRGTWRFLSR